MKEACKWEKFQRAIDQKEQTAMFLYDLGDKIYASSSGLINLCSEVIVGWQAQRVTACPRLLSDPMPPL